MKLTQAGYKAQARKSCGFCMMHDLARACVVLYDARSPVTIARATIARACVRTEHIIDKSIKSDPSG
jgi:hypothetical protein